MQQFVKPTVFASKCLGFAACRWNGATIESEIVRKLGAHVDFITHCPELEIGLGVPRPPVCVVEEGGERYLYQPETGRDLTATMRDYTAQTLSSLPEVDGFILKSRSPSCGLTDVKIYSGKDRNFVSAKGAGFFAAQVLERDGAGKAEDEGRLLNFTIRERFLIKIYIFADFRMVKTTGDISELSRFQARNKLLLMSFNQGEMREMGKLAAHPRGSSFLQIAEQYQKHLNRALLKGLRRGNVINAFMHMLGYFKKELKAAEKSYFLDLLEKYRAGRVPFSAVAAVLRLWVARTDQSYLRDQTFFEPYPEALLDISDSGKGRDY